MKQKKNIPPLFFDKSHPVYMCVFVCAFLPVCECMYVCVCVCIYRFVHLNVCAGVFICVCVCVCVCVAANAPRGTARVTAQIQQYASESRPKDTHTHTHTHTLPPPPPPPLSSFHLKAGVMRKAGWGRRFARPLAHSPLFVFCLFSLRSGGRKSFKRGRSRETCWV